MGNERRLRFRLIRKQSLNDLAVEISASAMVDMDMEPQLQEYYLVKAGTFPASLPGRSTDWMGNLFRRFAPPGV